MFVGMVLFDGAPQVFKVDSVDFSGYAGIFIPFPWLQRGFLGATRIGQANQKPSTSRSKAQAAQDTSCQGADWIIRLLRINLVVLL